METKWVIDDLTNVDHFEPDKDYNYPAQYTRNLAKVKVIFEKSEYLDVTALQNIEISNVPSTLSWDYKSQASGRVRRSHP